MGVIVVGVDFSDGAKAAAYPVVIIPHRRPS